MRPTASARVAAAILLLSGLGALPCPATAQTLFTAAFPPEEFARRRAEVMGRIGDGVAIVQGATEPRGEAAFRQNNRTFYLSGIEVPRAILVIDGRERRSVAYIPPDYRSRAYGPSLAPGEEAAHVTGLDAVLPRDTFGDAVAAFAREGRTVFTPHDAEILGNGSRGEAVGHARATREDPWDGRPSREEAFIARLREAGISGEIEDLDPLLREMRALKSPAEIAAIRRATEATGLGLMEAMRDARPGMLENELLAGPEYVFRRYGAQGVAYFGLAATGANTLLSHYHFGRERLRDGDLVQLDYAPDLDYYVSDVTRVFPANGRFSPRQREFYGIYLALYRSVLESIRPRAAPRDIAKDAVVRMDSVLAAFPFTDPKIEAAAREFADRYRSGNRNSLGHTIGLEVHDVPLGSEVLLPGHVFTIEPAMKIEDDGLGMRLEDVILITEDGVEILSDFVPFEMDDIEALMARPGLEDARVKPDPNPAQKGRTR